MTSLAESFSLEGRIALVTGAGGHLGSAMSRALCEAGAKLFANGRNVERIGTLVEGLRRDGFDAQAACFDITDDNAITDFVAQLRADEGRLDVLVNNAYGGSSGLLENTTRADYLKAYDLGVASAAQLVTASLDLIENGAQRTGTASIINIASMYGIVSPDFGVYTSLPPNPPIYGPAKSGLLQWTRYLACYLGPRGIRVNAVSPGAFPADNVTQQHPDFIEALSAKSPLRRIGKPQDLAGAVAFLASDAASFVTGANLVVDGGWTAW